MSEVKFEYRPTIKKIYWILIVLTILALLIVFRVNIIKLSAETYMTTLIKLVMVSLVPLSILVRLHFFIRPYIFSKYELKENILKIKFRRKEKIIDLNTVKQLKFTLFSPRFFGGCKIRTEAGDEVRFLSLLQNNHKIVEYLKKHKPDLKLESKFNKYIKTSQLVHLSWKRILIRLKNWLYIIVKFFIFPISFVVYLNYSIDFGESSAFSFVERLGTVSFVFLVLNFIISFFYNHFEELILNSKVESEESPSLEHWDFTKEKFIYILTQVIFFISASLVFYFLVRIFRHFISAT